jgi:putative endonuclease
MAGRVWARKEGHDDGFTSRYPLKRSVYAERHDDILRAIQREKNLKHWPRAWKVDLITAQSPGWEDLSLVYAFGE